MPEMQSLLQTVQCEKPPLANALRALLLDELREVAPVALDALPLRLSRVGRQFALAELHPLARVHHTVAARIPVSNAAYECDDVNF